MKKSIARILALVLITLSAFQLEAQVQDVKLVQTTGEFETKALTLEPGKYQFEIENSGVDHEVGFVLVPKGKYEQTDHIQNAYVTSLVKTGTSSKSKVVSLEAGEYEYFCPLNPTPKYTLTVSDQVEKVKLTQVPGAFKTKTLTLSEGDYQFEIENAGIDHEVGFVVVPKGKYDAKDHIKAAYVKAPVADGQSSQTNIVTLEAGEYEYFCPLNPTPKYSIVVR
ncbi:MAG: cupredoxin domain-containing protein [Bacteroidota bacterium]